MRSIALFSFILTMKNTRELKILSIVTAILLVAAIVFYIAGYISFGDIENFDTFYLWIFIFICGFAVFAILSLVLLAFNAWKKK